jgi:hypothetical protein
MILATVFDSSDRIDDVSTPSRFAFVERFRQGIFSRFSLSHKVTIWFVVSFRFYHGMERTRESLFQLDCAESSSLQLILNRRGLFNCLFFFECLAAAGLLPRRLEEDCLTVRECVLHISGSIKIMILVLFRCDMTFISSFYNGKGSLDNG